MGRGDRKVVAFKRPFRAVPLRAARNPPPLRFWEPKRPTWRQSLRQVRPWLFVIALLTAAAIFRLDDRANRPPLTIGKVDGQFTRCGYGRGANCVIDGDTFKIGERKIRVVGIDAAELAGLCDAERTQAEASTRALQDWLNRGPFEMASDPAAARDKYGRELMSVTRGGDNLKVYMTGQGGAHEYTGGARGGWC